MRFREYDAIRVILVDARFEADWPRVRDLVRMRGGDVTPFVCGKGEALPRHLYDQVGLQPPAGWQGTPGAYSLFEAMKSVVREASDSGAESLLFLEDDVALEDRFDEVLDAACRQIEEIKIEWDALYYGANHTWATTEVVAPNLLRVFGSLTTHCVGLRRSVFAPILNFPADAPIDVLFATQLHHAYRCYSVWPNVALQRPGYSHLCGMEVNYGHFFRSKGANQPAESA